jgi:hypothetical protein
MANDFCGPQVWPGTVQQLSGLSAYRKILKAFQHPHVRVQRAGRVLQYSGRPEKEGSRRLYKCVPCADLVRLFNRTEAKLRDGICNP